MEKPHNTGRWFSLASLERLVEPKVQIPLSQQRFSTKGLFELIIPTVIEQFLALLVGLVDTMMITYAGEAAASGVSLVDQLNNVFIMTFTALASGGAVVSSQYIGNKDKKNGSLAASQLVMLTSALSVVVPLIFLLRGTEIFQMLFGGVEADVRAAGLTYLRITAYSLPFLALYNSCAGLFRSMGKVKILMYVSIAMNTINVVGNAVGLFVLRAGVAGVAYPSLISRVFAAVMLLWLSMNRQLPVYVQIRQIFCFDAPMSKRILKIAVPGGIENCLFQLSKVALSSIVTLFGTMQIAAYGVAMSFWTMAGLFCNSIGPVFTTVIGQYMGSGDVDGAEYYNRKLLRIANWGSCIWNLFFLIITPAVLLVCDLPQETIRIVLLIVVLHNFFNALLCPSAFAFPNGLRAAGDAAFTMFASVLSTVVARLALSILFGVVFDLGVIGITIAMICDWTLKAALVFWRYRSGKWKTLQVI